MASKKTESRRRRRVRTIDNFLSVDQRDYAFSVVTDRAIPSGCDGLVPSQRKVLKTAFDLWRNPSAKPVKVFQLAGQVASRTLYHHGDASLNGVIIRMAQAFRLGVPLLDGIGQFGDWGTPVAASPRYVSVRLNPKALPLFPDPQIVEYREEEGTLTEPYFYLTAIPLMLCNGCVGIAVGYSTRVLPRNPWEVAKACSEVLRYGKVKKADLRPYYAQWQGTWEQGNTPSQWRCSGVCERKGKDAVVRLAGYQHTYESFEKHLWGLADKGKIEGFESPRPGVYEVYGIEGTDNDPLQISCTLSENITCLGEDNTLHTFPSAEEYLKWWVEWRLGWQERQRQATIERLREEASVASSKARFVQLVCSGKIALKGQKRAELVAAMEKHKLEKYEEGYAHLLSMPASSFTMETKERLEKEQKEKESRLAELLATTAKEMMLKQLSALKGKI